jgi:hypothetical protein
MMSIPATSAVGAVQCGSTDPQTDATARATLTLDPDSVTTLAYKRDTRPQTLLLRFKVTGCELPVYPSAPQIDLLPRQSTRDIPDGVVSLVRAVPDGAEYSLRLRADPKRFKPGSYGGFFELRAPYVITTRTPIALSRSESNEAVPIAIGAIGGIAGLVWFLLLRTAKGAKTVLKGWHYVIAFVAAAIAGVIAVESAYRAQDVWSVSDNLLSALAAAFTGATTGTMATAIGLLWAEPKP